MDQPPLDPFVDPPWTLAEFEEFLQEKPEGERWELRGGRIHRMMQGATVRHRRICGNITYSLTAAVRGRGSSCDVYQENTKITVPAANASFFPDVVVTCEKQDPDSFEVNHPVIIVEVLSRVSRERDKTVKLKAYRMLPSLRHYMIVDHARAFVEVTSRLADGSWGWQVLESARDRIRFPEIEAEMSLAEIYARVFDQPV